MAEEPLRTAADGRSSQLEGGKPEQDDGNHKILLQTVEGKFADMEHRMKSKKESSGTEEEHHGRLPGKVKGNEYSSSAANPAGTTHGTIEDDSDVASEVESGQLHYKSMW
ncbi:unnamed protein product [Sphagnum jensenii]|uniref:Uncharacterized protein n=1 Tax=Sphagnum jensenii TaxID=128206 RepID=A0ABP1ACN4_9BRYO